MGWEKRRGRNYYYRKERVGGKVVSKYVGRGEIAYVLAHFAEIEEEHRECQRIALEGERERVQGVEAVLAEVDRAARALLDVALADAGFHDHRGQWRRRRGQA